MGHRNSVAVRENKRVSVISSTSADEIAGNDDLLIEILLRLPIKSLLKFKSVSKRWLALISDPHFSHRRNSNSVSSGLLLFRFSRRFLNNNNPNPVIPEIDFVPFEDYENLGTQTPFKSLTFIDEPLGVHIFQSCNGLLCCCSNRVNKPAGNYYICNPTTKQYTKLPKPPVSPVLTLRTIFGISLAFDPSISPHYKAICVRSFGSSWDRFQISIYSSETGSWRVSSNPFSAYTNISSWRVSSNPFSAYTNISRFNGGVFWNGAIHWISTRGSSLYFDVDGEQLREMPMPPFPHGADEREFAYIGVSGGHFHIVEIYNHRSPKFIVYEMERDYSKWFVKFRVNINGVKRVFPEIIQGYRNRPDLHYYAFSILCVVRGESDEEEDSFLVLHLPGKAIRYNLKDKSCKKICDFAPDADDIVGCLRFRWFNAFQFIQSLSSV